jgi:GTPase SAR1 family protein
MSFNSIPQWVEDVKGIRGNDVIIILVGNKTDLDDKRFYKYYFQSFFLI